MASLGELNILLQLKGVSTFKKQLKDTETSVSDVGKTAQKSFDGIRPPVERARKQIDSFDKALKDVHKNLTSFSRGVREIQQASQLLATTLIGPLALSIAVASKTNRELNLTMQDIKHSTDDVLRSIGDSLTPIMQDVAKVVKDLSKQWMELPKAQRDAIVKQVAWTAAVALATTVAARFLRALTGLAKIMASPNGILTGGILAMTTLSAKLVDMWSKLNGEAITLAERMKRIQQTAVGMVNPGVGIGQMAANIGMGIGAKATGMPQGANLGGEPVDLGTSTFTKGAPEGFKTAMQGVRDELAKVKAEIDTVFGELMVNLPTLGQTIASVLKTSFETLTAGIGDAVAQSIVYGKNFEESMRGILKGLAAEVISFLVTTIAKVIVLRALGVIGPISAAALGMGGGGVGTPASGGESKSGGGFLSGLKNIFGFADGGVVTKPTLGVFGEAGPEAVIPLDEMDSMGGGVTVNLNGHTFLDDEGSIDKLVRKLEDSMKRASRRRTGGTSIAF